ncbi:hypothetical protein TGPRC2_225320 [Toxoplasma gondii TgCatPRC2]|uniref:Transmembrane protein n=5 Tax=Toxoplasma gondii TaxID=5811 RepID=A0A151HR52_TOXGO|nr:hypothetical protein TGME49_225320 [Toxoplasma gondii ME49]KFG45507.1 hypothetical protein TGDOM2_225320 [Toxoplasma gondii GAB2-2007-GAL-DOM2]KYF43175.1 hypothetical protein TGARI_225320 [Toxoplasma gondii ARI]KYK71895.1 hypothetical protein TGPRC2_225320 [Toxoplasma gondii TgCatPRC2]PIM03977.1 hypothetical protein TGCOUG_225320 [Toxoplasma gondii COUG]EPT27039.1 hypothetical protein TGME49_225320 [Toxoplasma gondii ME49]|eukprot:XP_002366205.1 hypothetical protein TGME49_225320 [Toxoplasma gondii ME49]
MDLFCLLIGSFFFLSTSASARQTQGGLSVLQAEPLLAPDSTAFEMFREERRGDRMREEVEFSQIQLGERDGDDDDDPEDEIGEEEYEEGGEGDSSRGSSRGHGGDASQASEVNRDESYEAEDEREPSQKDAKATRSAPIGHEAFTMKLMSDSPRVGYADGQEACSALGCPRVAAGGAPRNPISGCAKSVKCRGCHGRMEAEARCQAWKPSTRPDVILSSGWYFTKHMLTRSGAMELDIQWDNNSDLDFKKCMPDLRQVTRSFKELQETGNVAPFAFHRMVNVQVAVHRLPSEGMEDKGPKKLSFSIKFVDPQASSLIGRTGQSQSQPMCSSVDATLPMVNLGRKTAMYGVGWLPIPNDLTFPVTTKNFVIRMQCSGVQSCNMNRIAVCARITCPATATVAEQQMAAVQDAMSKPVGNGPASRAAGLASGDSPASRVMQASTGRFGSTLSSQVPLVHPGASPYSQHHGAFPHGYPYLVLGHAATRVPSAFVSAFFCSVASIALFF